MILDFDEDALHTKKSLKRNYIQVFLKLEKFS